MNAEFLLNVTPTETRAAIVENGMLQEVYFERSNSRGIVGNIYKGKVIRVLPGMQAAFVDIGLEKAAFIHASDIVTSLNTADKRNKDQINSLVHDGQTLVVQVTKDPIGTKGARLTTYLSVPSRYLVFMPFSQHVGISQRIEDENERNRLRKIVQESLNEEGLKDQVGFILRTAADGVDDEEIRADVKYLQRLWASIEESTKATPVKHLIYEELPLYLRLIRDEVRPGVESILIDSRETFTKVEQFVKKFTPEYGGKLEYYPGERPIFDLYSIEDEIQRALEKQVPLKSGGHLVIDQTEAMATIDVNTGAYVGSRNLEETIFKTNLEAATAIGRQLRLRNLGGIIIVDFIDMTDQEHQRQVIRVLEKVLEKDHAKTKISGVTELGLVQVTRKRTRESLEHSLCEPCPQCHGRGHVKTAETVCYEIFREILREARAYDRDAYIVLASQSVIDRLLDEEASSIGELEEFIQKPITLQVEPMYEQEQFDVILQ